MTWKRESRVKVWPSQWPCNAPFVAPAPGSGTITVEPLLSESLWVPGPRPLPAWGLGPVQCHADAEGVIPPIFKRNRGQEEHDFQKVTELVNSGSQPSPCPSCPCSCGQMAQADLPSVLGDPLP